MGDSQAINNAFGYDNSRANYDFVSGGNVYRLNNGNNGTRNVQQVDTVANRMAQQAKWERQEAIKPAIQSLEATKPEITKLYDTERTRLEGNKQPLQDRYKSLLDQIKGREKIATDRTSLTVNNEMARRGISNTSGVYEKEMSENLNPITSEYAGLIKDTSLAQEDGLKGISDAIAALLPKQTADIRGITQEIANLQANTGNQSVTDWLTLSQQGLENQWKEREFQESARRYGIEEALKRMEMQGSGGLNELIKLSQGQVLYDPRTGQPVYTNPKTYAGVSGAFNAGGQNRGGI